MTRVVYAGDEWEYEDGVAAGGETQACNPTADHSDGQVIAAYAVATRPGNMDPDFEVMDRATLDSLPGVFAGEVWPVGYALR